MEHVQMKSEDKALVGAAVNRLCNPVFKRLMPDSYYAF